ncbi:hypothetical protein C8Q72DRAFT_863270 [Fomitopsis betulina]|nr:hypothetical protein C8Q72DRAFT_863270 [Fomitopsis betulina]
MQIQVWRAQLSLWALFFPFYADVLVDIARRLRRQTSLRCTPRRPYHCGTRYDCVRITGSTQLTIACSSSVSPMISQYLGVFYLQEVAHVISS